MRSVRCGCWVVFVAWAMLGAASAGTSELPPGLTTEEARRLVAEVVPRVERLRGLTFKEPVPVEVVNDAAVREYILARLREFDQEQRFEKVQRAYELLGLVPEGAVMLDLVLEALEEQAGGFYDPSRGAYYLVDDVPVSAAPILTAHELTHALEDQYFDLDWRLREAISNDDRLLARSAIHEGSATVLMSVYVVGAMAHGELDSGALLALAETEAGRAAKLRALPDVLIRQILGPYVLGAMFLSGGDLLAVAQGFPKDAVNQAIDAGPTSSEQLLHPEKYWDGELRDEPVEVELPSPEGILGKRWELQAEGVLGELMIATLVGAETPLLTGAGGIPNAAAWTNAAAAGWGGDRWQLWERGGRSVLLLLTDWDTPGDATEFAAALPEQDGFTWRIDGRQVALVAGDVGRKTPRLLARLLTREDSAR